MTQREIEAGLRELGLGAGDIVLLHSSLRSFGRVDGGARTVVDAFLAVLGPEGTLVVPTFGALGVITEVVREDPRAVRSVHPLASVAAIGADAAALCADHWKAATAHGEGTPYTRIAERGGYVCLAGVDQDRNTTLHTAEALLGLPYLSDKTATFETGEGERTATWRFFPGPHRDFIGLDRLLRERGVLRIGRIGESVIRLMKSQELIDACLEAGKADPAFVLCDNPNCADCVAQRAAIRAARFEGESFRLAASSGLAGRYVPEMIDNLEASGVRAVEVDLVEGRPAQALAEPQLAGAIHGLREGGCEVIALRALSVPEFVESFLDRARAAGVGRVVLPLSSRARHHAACAAERGVHVSFSNATQGSVLASEMLLELAKGGAGPRFTLNAAHLARAGEKPFLYSYKKKLHRFIDQLDLEDCCFDGTPQALARGNAEIKELVSILRCAGFRGIMTLTTANRAVGGLGGAVARFEALLEAM
ncbi:MAG: AAC(3) family N-acetyltransferase [Candidatus Hydrogenedentes bacterium]|nr:AAC(3) family N-acetyltransferase [Candidatus Hydrogenedentota bacterium]